MKNRAILCLLLTAGLILGAVAYQQTKKVDTTAKKPAITCPVSGEAIKNTARAPRYTYRGKTYYFCCKDCLTKFKASPATYLNRKPAPASNTSSASKACCSAEKASGGSCCAGEKGAATNKGCCSTPAASSKESRANPPANQGNNQPSSEQQADQSAKLFCPVSEEEITPDEAIAFEYNGKRYYVCCSNCRRKFLADPETYARKAEQLSPLQGKPISEQK